MIIFENLLKKKSLIISKIQAAFQETSLFSILVIFLVQIIDFFHFFFQVLHFSPALYNYVTKSLHKSMILVINKIDLAPRALTVAWKHYLLKRFPELKIVLFSANPSEAAYSKGGDLQQQRRGNVFSRV